MGGHEHIEWGLSLSAENGLLDSSTLAFPLGRALASSQADLPCLFSELLPTST